MGTERGRPLGAGEHDRDRVLEPRALGRGLSEPAPNVDQSLAANAQCDRGANFLPRRKILEESGDDRLEARIVTTLDRALRQRLGARSGGGTSRPARSRA